MHRQTCPSPKQTDAIVLMRKWISWIIAEHQELQVSGQAVTRTQHHHHQRWSESLKEVMKHFETPGLFYKKKNQRLGNFCLKRQKNKDFLKAFNLFRKKEKKDADLRQEKCVVRFFSKRKKGWDEIARPTAPRWTYQTRHSCMADCRGTEVVCGGGGCDCGRSPAGWGHYTTPPGRRHWRGQNRASLCEEEPGGKCRGGGSAIVSIFMNTHQALLFPTQRMCENPAATLEAFLVSVNYVKMEIKIHRKSLMTWLRMALFDGGWKVFTAVTWTVHACNEVILQGVK